MAELTAHDIKQSEHKKMVWILISNWPVQNISHNFLIQSRYSLLRYFVWNHTWCKELFTYLSHNVIFVVQNVSVYKTSTHIKFLHIQNFSTSESSPHLKFIHMTKNSTRTMFTASATNIKYAPGPTDNAIEHVMFGMISWCIIALLSIRCKIVWCQFVWC